MQDWILDNATEQYKPQDKKFKDARHKYSYLNNNYNQHLF